MTRTTTLPKWIALLALAALAVAASATAAEIEKPPMAAKVPAGIQPPLTVLPDLAVEKIEYSVVKRQTWADGVTPCQIFNLTATLANLGSKATQEFQVRVDRKKPNWEIACIECTATVPGLGPGERRPFGPRQFNNCGPGASNEFRVVLDPLGQNDARPENNSLEKTFVPPPLLSKPPHVEKKVDGR